MGIFKKIKRSNGYRDIFILGVKILSYNIVRSGLDKYCLKTIGVGSEIQSGCRIYYPDNISIGDNVRIGQGALV